MVPIETYKRCLDSLKQELEDVKLVIKLINFSKDTFTAKDMFFANFERRQHSKYGNLNTRISEIEQRLSTLEKLSEKIKENEVEIARLSLTCNINQPQLNLLIREESNLLQIKEKLEQEINVLC